MPPQRRSQWASALFIGGANPLTNPTAAASAIVADASRPRVRKPIKKQFEKERGNQRRKQEMHFYKNYVISFYNVYN